MKIFNVRLDLKKLMIYMGIIILILLTISIARLFIFASTEKEYIEMTTDNYTNLLKDCHENIDSYVGKNIKTSGYVFRAADFKANQIVVARDMIVKYPNDLRIVGFLCENKDAKLYQDRYMD